MKKVSTIKDRMREALDVKGLRAVDIVERTGIPKGSISQYMLGKVEPKQNRLIPIANALGVNMYWLQGYDVPMEKNYFHYSEVIPNQINFYERVAAGDSSNNVMDTYMELIRILPRNPEEYFAVRVSGDSMLPTISDGDTVLVRRQNDVENGEIAVVSQSQWVYQSISECTRDYQIFIGISVLPEDKLLLMLKLQRCNICRIHVKFFAKILPRYFPIRGCVV